MVKEGNTVIVKFEVLTKFWGSGLYRMSPVTVLLLGMASVVIFMLANIGKM